MKTPFFISTDGFIRIDAELLMGTSLHHIISMVESTETIASKTHYYGFTEWATSATPALSIGWDWQLIEHDGKSDLKRLGAPRSNIMIIDASHQDIGFLSSEEIIGAKVDTMFWESIIYQQIPAAGLNIKLSKHFT